MEILGRLIDHLRTNRVVLEFTVDNHIVAQTLVEIFSISIKKLSFAEGMKFFESFKNLNE